MVLRSPWRMSLDHLGAESEGLPSGEVSEFANWKPWPNMVSWMYPNIVSFQRFVTYCLPGRVIYIYIYG